MIPLITIDGPSGVGKGTLCRLLAAHRGWHLLDSGALYRLTAQAALNRQLDLHAAAAVAEVAATLAAHFEVDAQREMRIWLDGAEVTDLIRSEQAGQAASIVAAHPAVRSALLARQRAYWQAPGLVADGRDMGTVVFPEAKIKLYLTASAEVRAQRRYKQLKEKGISASLAALIEDISERDQRDAERTVAPLRPAADAYVLDTGNLSIEQVLSAAEAHINKWM